MKVAGNVPRVPGAMKLSTRMPCRSSHWGGGYQSVQSQEKTPSREVRKKNKYLNPTMYQSHESGHKMVKMHLWYKYIQTTKEDRCFPHALYVSQRIL